MNLSPHFTLAEFEFSQNAIRFGIANRMTTKAQLLSARSLCGYVLEPIRARLEKPVFITSGFRNPAVNLMAGGSTNSQHLRAEAADIHVSGMTTEQLFWWIIKSGIVFDQIIAEFDSWVHITYKWNRPNRRSILRAYHNKAGVVVYERVNESDPL